MKLLIDGLAFDNKTQWGIGRIFQTVLPMICDLDPALAVRLLACQPANPALPTHPHIRIERLLPLDRLLSPIQVWKSTRFYARNLALVLPAREQPDAIWHSTFFTQPLGWRGPIVTTVYDLITMLLPHYYRGWGYDLFRHIQRTAIQSADCVIAISATTARDLQECLDIPASRIQHVPNGVSPHFRRLEADEPRQLPTQRPFLLYVGHRGDYKNFDTLAQAYCRWPRRTEFDLVAVGPPWSAQERATFRAAGVLEQAHVVTGASDEQLVHLYNAAAVFVYPSLYEGFGLPLLEAMACGCPIVASRIPSSLEVAQEYPLYFEPSDVDALIQALDQVIDHELTPAQQEQSRQVHTRYSWEKTARGTLAAYYAVAGRSPR